MLEATRAANAVTTPPEVRGDQGMPRSRPVPEAEVGGVELVRSGIRSCGDAVVIAVEGEIDISSLVAWQRQLAAATNRVRPPGPLVVDLTGLEFLGGCGIGVIAAADRRCRRSGFPLRVVADRQMIRRIAALGVLDGARQVFPSVPAALTRRPAA